MIAYHFNLVLQVEVNSIKQESPDKSGPSNIVVNPI
ncbi:MAG: hypothetical protein JWR76_679 [Mucilaginibacter sp.]|nr:hypothetical protein [Mucilaginibacter sp.]